MPRFFVKATYAPAGVKGLVKEGGTRRAESIRKLIESAGGRLESVNFAVGKSETYVVCELPDNTSATAMALTVNAAGFVNVRITPVLTPEELDAASRQKVEYVPPGE